MVRRVSKLGYRSFASIDDETDQLIFHVGIKTWNEWLAEGHPLWIMEPPIALDGVFQSPTHFGPTDELASLLQGIQASLINSHAQGHFLAEELGNSNIIISKDTGKAYAICSKHIGEEDAEAMKEALEVDIGRFKKFVMLLLQPYPHLQSTIEYVIFMELYCTVIPQYQHDFDTLCKFEILVSGSPLLWTDEDRDMLFEFFYICDKNIKVIDITLSKRIDPLTSLGTWFERVPRPQHYLPSTRKKLQFDFDERHYPLFNIFTSHGYDTYVQGKGIISYMKNITQHLQTSAMELENNQVSEQYIKSILPEALPKIFFAVVTVHNKEKLGSERLEDGLINRIEKNIRRYKF